VSEVTVEIQIHDRLGDRPVVQLLRLVDVMTAGIASGMKVSLAVEQFHANRHAFVFSLRFDAIKKRHANNSMIWAAGTGNFPGYTVIADLKQMENNPLARYLRDR